MRMKFCVACFSDKNLHHHHLVPKSIGGTNDQTNLITLCGSCHGKIHGVGESWTSSSTLIKLGMERRKSNGFKSGRPAKLSSIQVYEMKLKRESGIKIKDLMSEYSLSKASVYRLIGELI